MKINVSQMLSAINYTKLINNTNSEICIDILDVYTNSKQVKINSIYIALKGVVHDGHQFINEAVVKGAVIIICQDIPKITNDNILYIVVPNTREYIYQLMNILYGKELEKIKAIGITGTNGKTTTSYLCYNLFRKLGYKTGLISTIDIKINDKSYATTNTTPDILSLNKYLYKMVQEKCEYVFMEISSHALIQKRAQNINFHIAALTNITHDHLDYHQTFENYIKAKKILFDNLTIDSIALVNKDDKHWQFILQNTKAIKKTYALKNMANFKASVIEKNLLGTKLLIEAKEVWVKLAGLHNAYNILLAYSIATLLLKKDTEQILKHISSLNNVKGRFDTTYLNNGVSVIIDYAHTPDGVKNILESINNSKQKDQKIITLIGAGGDRDETKRPKMAYYAYSLSNKLILTSDNPRNEDPQKIINDMKTGLPEKSQNKLEEILDRKQAIIHALSIAVKNDIVVILGKGHEQYIDVNGKKLYFSEIDIIQEFNNNIIA